MPRKTKDIEHGTVNGYVMERRRGLETCEDCRKAWRDYYHEKNQEKT